MEAPPKEPSEAVKKRRTVKAKRDFNRLREAGVYPPRSEVLCKAQVPRHRWLEIQCVKPDSRRPWAKLSGTWYYVPAPYALKYRVGHWLWMNEETEPKVKMPGAVRKVVLLQFRSKAPVDVE